jgi:hypothetical protein
MRPKPRQTPDTVPNKKAILMADLSKASIAQDHIDAVMSMMDPGEFTSGTTRIPARGAWLRNVTTESIVRKLSKADGSVSNDGSFSLEARARPDGALILRGGAAVAESAAALSGQVIAPNAVSTAAGADNQFSQVVCQQGDVVSGAILGTIAAGGTQWVVPISSTAGGNISFTANNPTIGCRILAKAFTGPIGALVSGGAAQATNVAPGALGLGATLALPANTTHVGFSYDSVAVIDQGKKLQATIALVSSATLKALGNEGKVINLTTLAGVKKLRAYRVCGQSLLLTYTGSQINNGGDIAVARVSASWAPDPGTSVYESLLKLPKTRRMAGRVAKGAHCFWVPETVEDFEPKLYGPEFDEVEKPSYKIVAAGSLDDPEESIMLQLETIVEFQSDEPSYASVEYAPHWSSFDIALAILARLNPCDENPSHLARIRKFLAPKIKAAIQYGIDNPAQVASVIAKVLPMLL